MKIAILAACAALSVTLPATAAGSGPLLQEWIVCVNRVADEAEIQKPMPPMQAAEIGIKICMRKLDRYLDSAAPEMDRRAAEEGVTPKVMRDRMKLILLMGIGKHYVDEATK